MSFRGEVEMKDIDAGTHTLRLIGKGTDTTGSSGASMDLTARVEASEANRCNLVGVAEVSMSGKAVAFGGRMMNAVADQILKQFADNFAAKVGALQVQSDATPPPGGGSAAPTASTAPAVAAPASPPETDSLNGIALMWAIFKDLLRGLFAKKSA
jgi:hypothetical protein